MRIVIIGFLLALAGCTPEEGQRCNPQQFTSDCQAHFSCVYPPGCAVAYCCRDDGSSSDANCQACSVDGG